MPICLIGSQKQAKQTNKKHDLISHHGKFQAIDITTEHGIGKKHLQTGSWEPVRNGSSVR